MAPGPCALPGRRGLLRRPRWCPLAPGGCPGGVDMNAPPWCLVAPGASLLLGHPELRSGVLVGRFKMPSGLQPRRYMTVTGPAPCRNWAPAILIRLPRSAPIPCEWAPSPDSSALAYFDHAADPVVTGLAARSSGAARRHQQRLPRASRRVGQTLAGRGGLVRPPLIRRTGCRQGTSRTGRGSDQRQESEFLPCLAEPATPESGYDYGATPVTFPALSVT